MSWFSTEENYPLEDKNDASSFLSYQFNSIQGVIKEKTMKTENTIIHNNINNNNNNNNNNNAKIAKENSKLWLLVDSSDENTKLLDITSKQRLPSIFPSLSMEGSVDKNYQRQKQTTCQVKTEFTVNNNKPCCVKNLDEIDQLYNKLRKQLNQNHILENYFLIILQHLIKSLLLIKPNSVNMKSSHANTLKLYNSKHIIIIWKQIIEKCHLLICSTGTPLQQDNFLPNETLSTKSIHKSQSFPEMSNIIINNNNYYLLNVSYILHNPYYHCFGASLPVINNNNNNSNNANKSTPLMCNKNIHEMHGSTSTSDFESLCSDNELTNKSIKSEQFTDESNKTIILSQNASQESSGSVEVNPPALSSSTFMSKTDSSHKCKFESNTVDEKEEELVISKKSDTSSSMSFAPGCTPPPPPPLLLPHPPPPPPLPPPLITSSASPVIATSNNFLSKNQQAGNSVPLSTNQTANNFINLAKLNVLFVQQQKQTVKSPEVKISLIDEISSRKCTQIDESSNNNISSYCHMARDNDIIVQDKKLTVFQINNPKRLDVTSAYPTRGRSLSSSRTMEFVQKHYEANLLESQRCLNVNIFLRQFRNSHINLLDLIDQCDGSLIGSERLRDLIKLLPTDEEIKTFKSFQGNINYMDPAERFFYDLVRIPK
ncbi:unnamed protein product [Trichobilharzia regenti]|nr:unnamed protein product [Trichobilharzia regenti]